MIDSYRQGVADVLEEAIMTRSAKALVIMQTDLVRGVRVLDATNVLAGRSPPDRL
jgi:hypothetical protein